MLGQQSAGHKDTISVNAFARKSPASGGLMAHCDGSKWFDLGDSEVVYEDSNDVRVSSVYFATFVITHASSPSVK